MKKIFIFFIFFTYLIISGCGQKKVEVKPLEDSNIDSQMIKAYNEGLTALDNKDYMLAVKKFGEAEILYPQSIWAPRSALMTAYSYYVYERYFDTIFELERFLKTYPEHNRQNYAYYLLGLAYYEQIVDEKKDLEPIINSKKYFQIIINEYPGSEYAADAEFKLDLIKEILAAKEMYLGRYYIEKEKWIPAINRYKTILENYDDTIYVEEAIHRLVEIHYKVGLINESKKYANLLGYNYQSGEWYEKSYKIFNKNYEKPKIKTAKNKKTIIQRLRSLIN
ncbi:outer membrane protein assembly factor BamD [Candidatus Pelagibacter sp.]|jgi:outer membrane protein assembly factor BamD|nr:outer membrane protein assembly factor BamD [Candidatus Pelagibacter sp.]MDA9709033.1 outer membrane protein assembly factor BamD [Candidatus Pelagibacter sp.]